MQHQALSSLRQPCISFQARARISSSRATSARPFVVRAGLNDIINKVSVAIQNSPLSKGKAALAKLQAGDFDQQAVESKVDAYISENPVMIFSFSTCPFCIRGKKILEDLGVKYTAIELNQMGSDGMAIRAVLAERTGRTSMPNIWIGGQGIGGCNDGPGIATLQANGELIPMLQKAGAL